MKIKNLEIILVGELLLICLLVYAALAYDWRAKGTDVPAQFAGRPKATRTIPAAAPFAAQDRARDPLETSDPDLFPLTPAPLGPLSSFQQRQLQIAAQRHLAPTPQDALQMAKTLDFIGQQGHPSNMCGPLAVSILREAGLLPADTPLAKFWLLNPREATNRRTLENYFPPDRFEHIFIKKAVNKIDWQAQPLLPGDFVYLYAGEGGNFEHMLVVTRGDGFGRVFSVTNYATLGGFVIQEQMLYDPLAPESGLFYEWTRKPYAKLGATGFGGIEIWRLRAGAALTNP